MVDSSNFSLNAYLFLVVLVLQQTAEDQINKVNVLVWLFNDFAEMHRENIQQIELAHQDKQRGVLVSQMTVSLIRQDKRVQSGVVLDKPRVEVRHERELLHLLRVF